MDSLTTVRVLQVPHYEKELLRLAVQNIFANWGGYEQLTPETRVTIKPNLLMRRDPSQATTTHPLLLEVVVEQLREKGVEQITIADSPGGPFTQVALKSIYKGCEMQNLEPYLNYDVGYGQKKAVNGVLIEEFNLINPILQGEVIINIGKMKTHAMTTLSGGVKNLFGCVPGLQKPEFHYQFPENHSFCQMLVDLAVTVSPDLTIIDGILAMEGDGPSGGTPKEVGVLVSSPSPFAVDMVLADMMHIPLAEVSTIVHSQNRGLAPQTLAELSIVGDGYRDMPEFLLPSSKSLDFSDHIPFFLRPVAHLLKRCFITRPVIRLKECVGCGKCAESCPAKTITIENHKAVIDYSHCISCFCCHEMCPYKVIDMKTRGIWRK